MVLSLLVQGVNRNLVILIKVDNLNTTKVNVNYTGGKANVEKGHFFPQQNFAVDYNLMLVLEAMSVYHCCLSLSGI